jgi:general secretion pathway protein D
MGVCLAAACLAGGDAGLIYREGQKAEKAGEMARAYLLYSQAAALEPFNSVYWLRSQAVRTRGLLEAKPKPRIETSATPRPEPLDTSQLDAVTERDLADARRPQPPKQLKALPGLMDFDLNLEPRALVHQVAITYGLDAVFDGDYPESGARIRFRMEQADYREALHAVEAVTGSFIVPLSDKLFLVVKDTVQKRQEKEPSVTVVVDIPQPVTVQEAQELAIAVRQAMEIRKFGVDTQRRIIVMRDSISKIWPARQLVLDLMGWRPQVAVELEFFEVSTADARSIGLDVTKQFPLVSLGHILGSASSIPEGITALATFGGGKTLFGIGLANATLIARMSRSDGRSLMRSGIRSADGQPATFHVGDRYPIMTNGYFGQVEGNGQVNTPPPSFNFEDLGLKLKVTPKIHGTEEVSLEVEAEFKVLSGQSLNSIPVISERKLNSRVRLRNEEWGIMAGMMSVTEARTISGLAGLTRVPLLGALMSTHNRDRDSRVVLILMKPRLLSMPPSEMLTGSWWTGSESRPLTPL